MKSGSDDMECPNCNKTYDDDFKFCPYCGEEKPKPKICPNCELEPSVEFSFCPECGTKLVSKSQWEELNKLKKREELNKLKKREELNKLNDQLREYEKLGEYEKAFECIDKAIELKPENISYWEEKREKLNIPYWEEEADRFMRLRKYLVAIEFYDKLIKLEPENISYWEEKKRCFHRLGRYEESKECANKLIELRRAL